MRVLCLQENLKEGVLLVERIVGKQVTLPILNNILIETEKAGLLLSATDLEIGIHVKIAAKIEKPGKISIPAKVLANYITNLPNKKISLELKQTTLEVQTNGYHASFQGQSPEDFPIIPTIKKETTYTLPQKTLRHALERVVGITSLSESRPELTGVYVIFENNVVRFVATDSFRLAETTIVTSQSFLKESFILPAKSVLEIVRVMTGEYGEEIIIAPQKNQLLFEIGNIKLITRLIEGEYPNYQEIIPKTFETEVHISRETLLQGIKVSSFFTGKNNDVRLLVRPSLGTLEISARGVGVGESSSTIPISGKGKDMEMMFNYKFLLDGLECIQDKDVTLKLNSELTPAVLQPAEKKNYLYLIMPIKPT